MMKSCEDDAVPWITYAAIERLGQLIQPSWDVFEWGSGNSTLYFAARVMRLVSMEHDRNWFDIVSLRVERAFPMPARVYRLYQQLPTVSGGRGYLSSIQRMWRHAGYDLVMVDGRLRCRCVEVAMPFIWPGGWLLLDNTERDYYQPAVDRLLAAGWTAEHYRGPGPLNDYEWQTSFFQKPL